MVDRLFSSWLNWPLWARWASVVGVLGALDAMRMAWPERDFLTGFAQSLVAIAFKYGAPVLSIAAGWWLGAKVARRSNVNWLGWVAGVSIAIGVAFTLYSLAESFPGVKWRLDAMDSDNCYTDWDGRTNPVVCD